MKPEIYTPECPEHLVKKAEEEHIAWIGKHYHNYWPDIIWQEERNGLLYTYIYDGRKVCEEDDNTPVYLIAADMKEERWDTYCFVDGRWGQKMLESIAAEHGHPVMEYTDAGIYGRSLYDMQKKVRQREQKERRGKREREIEKDMAKAEEFPQAFLSWAERRLDPYLVYDPEDNHRGYCTRCRKEMYFHKKLKCHSERMCPSCRSRCVVKTQKCLPEKIEKFCTYIQRTGNGIMIRFVKTKRKLQGYYREADLETDERIRVVIDRGKRQRWYEKITDWRGTRWQRNEKEGWTRSVNDPCRQYWRTRIGCIRSGRQEPDLYKRNLLYVIRESNLGYVDGWEDMLETLTQRTGRMRIFDFIELYDRIHRCTQAESLWKIGFRNLAVDIITTRGEFKDKEKKLYRYLGISKEMWRFIKEKTIRDRVYIRDIKNIRYYDGICTDKEMAWNAAQKIPPYYRDEIQGLPLNKVLKYLKKNKVQLYADYIRMAKNLGFDLKDEFVAFPKNLKEAHDEALSIRDEERNRKELEKAKKDDAAVGAIYKKIQKQFTFECGEYVFRPAKSNYEIVMEGQAQHHCVGGGLYKKKMLAGESYIILMRKINELEKPYYTIEIRPDGKILQAYGKYNKKPDWDTVGGLIEQYSQEVRERKCHKASCRKTDGDVTVVAQTA